MSLGINISWRARHESLGVARLSLIPREFLTSCRPVLITARPSHHSSHPAAHRTLHVSRSPVGRAAERTKAATIPTSRFPKSTDAAPDGASQPPPPPTPGSTLVARLADVPIRQHGLQRSVLIEPLLTYPHKVETKKSRMRHHQSLTRQARLEVIRQAQLKPLPDWRVVLQNLTAWTPDASRVKVGAGKGSSAEVYRRDAVKITVPETAVSELLSGVDYNLWDIRKRTSCELRLHRRSEQDGSSMLFLSGDDRALSRAVTEILQHAKGSAVVPPEAGEVRTTHGERKDKSDQPSLEVISTEEQRKTEFGPYIMTQSASRISKPAVWTKESFLGYVAALVKGELPSHLASRFNSKKNPHDDAVISLLHGAFNEEAARSSLSMSAFKMALAFMAHKGHRHRPDARALYVRMEMFGLAMDVETFNILLASTAKVKDLRNFDSTLRLMNGRGFAPDLTTWILFIRVLESEEVKRYIIHSMSSKGLLDTPSAVRLVAKEMVPFDIDRAVQQNLDIPAFFAEQETRYGPEWLSRSAANKILEVLGRYGRFDACTALLNIMADNPHAQPDIVSFNTVLTHCKRQHKLGIAINTVRQMERLAARRPGAAPRLAPDETTYHLLFELAWKRRMVSLVGVTWRYASLARATSYRMRLRASQALAAASPSRSEPPTGTSKSLAAAAATMMPARAVLDDRALREGALDPKVPVGARQSRTPRRERRLGPAASAYYARRYAGWEPAVPLGEVLVEAYARDREYLLAAKKTRHEGEGGGGDDAAAAAVVREPMSFPLRKTQAGGDDGDGDTELTRRIYF